MSGTYRYKLIFIEIASIFNILKNSTINIIICVGAKSGHYESISRQSYFDVLGYLPPVSEKVMEKRDKHLNQAETWRARTDKMARRAIK